MKKILLLLLITIVFTSCDNSEVDSLTGKWKVQSIRIGNVENTNLSECDQQSVYVFRSDKAFVTSGYPISSEGEICMLFDFSDDNWKKSNNGLYQIVNKESGDIRAEVEKVSRDTIIIQNIDGYDSNFKKVLVRL